MLRSPILFLIFDILLTVNCISLKRTEYAAPSQFQQLSLTELSSTTSRPEEYFEQKLDHFTETDSRTWKQRYFTEISFYALGGPAYLWVGQEGPIYPNDLDDFYWTQHGRTNKAIIFQPEHRFYGASQPLGDLSLESLHYLTVAQALADMAAFISAMNAKHKLPADIKWIVFGSSYSGMLAAWMRDRYPDLVHGAVASSAPVNFKMEIPDYFDATAETYAESKTECSVEIAKANKELEDKLQTPQGREEIGKIFKLCGPLTGEKLDTAFFLYYNFAADFGDTLQYVPSEKSVQDICNKMFVGADRLSPMQRYANLVKTFMENFGETCLYTSFKDYGTTYTNIDFYDSESEAYNSNRQWKYQQCTEVGLHSVVGPNNEVFSKLITFELYEAWCIEAFGKSFNKAFTSKGVDSMINSFGGASIDTPRIVFVNGLLDPWRTLSITSKDNNPNVDVILIKGVSHGADMYVPTELQPQELRDVQKQLASLVDGWLKQPK